MRKFLLSLLLLVVLAPSALRADEVIVGTIGTTSANTVPFNTMKADSYTQSIYPMNEIGGAMTITEVAYSCKSPNITITSSVKVYIGETEKTAHVGAEDWLTSEELKLVYEGTGITLGGKDWESFTFNAPYNYSGEKNLVIAVSTSGGTGAGNQNGMMLKWYTVTGSSMCNSAESSEPAADPSTKSVRPVIRLTGEFAENDDNTEDEPVVITLDAPVVSAEATSSTTIKLSWNAVADSVNYLIYIGEENIGGTYDTTYVVQNCTPSTYTCFTVVATKGDVKSEASEEACAFTPAGAEAEEPTVEIPAAPTNVVATATSDTTVVLTWTAVEGAESYNVYFHQSETSIATVTATEYTVKDLTAETEYSFVVTASNTAGESAISDVVKVTTLKAGEEGEPLPACDAPTNLAVQYVDQLVVLTWEGTEGHLLWELRYSEANSTSWVTIDSIESPTWVIEDLTENGSYIWNVRAFCSAGRVTDWSEQGTFTIGPAIPEAPVVTATASNDTVRLSWLPVHGATSYKVYYGEQVLKELEETALDVRVPKVGTYCFTVTAVNELGESPKSNEACATIEADPELEVPAVPVLEAKLASDSVLLTWKAVELATYYNVYYITNEGDKLISSLEGTEFKIKLSNPGEYCFYITAANLAGESEKSNTACVNYGEGIEENAATFNIYPNPVSDNLYIETEAEVIEVVVYDVYGRQQVAETPSHQGNLTIDVTNLNSGVYFVKVVTENGEAVQRFIKK